MRSQFNRTDPAHHKRGCLKQPAFHQPRHANRPAEPKHQPHRLPIRPPKALKQMKLAQLWHPSRIENQNHQRHHLHHQRGNRSPPHPQLWRAPMAKDQRIGQRQIDPNRQKRRPKHHLRALKGGKIAFQRHHQKRGDHPQTGNPQEILRKSRHLGLLAQRQKHRFGIPKQRIGQKPKADRQPKPHAGIAAHLHLVTAADRTGHHRHHRLGKARAKDKNHKKRRGRQHHSRKLADPIPSQQYGIGHMQRHLRQMAADQGQAQIQGGAGVTRIGDCFAHKTAIRLPYHHIKTKQALP